MKIEPTCREALEIIQNTESEEEARLMLELHGYYIHSRKGYYDTAIANPDNGTHECSLILTPCGPKANIINKYETTDWRLVKFRHIHALLSGNYHVLE